MSTDIIIKILEDERNRVLEYPVKFEWDKGWIKAMNRAIEIVRANE